MARFALAILRQSRPECEAKKVKARVRVAEQINALQAVSPGDEAHPASDWKRRSRIFGVTFGGKEYFAGYQFDAMCQPLPVVRDILAALGPLDDSWKIAAWFHFPNGWIASRSDHQGEPVAPNVSVQRHRTRLFSFLTLLWKNTIVILANRN
ncbi:hypothetical protein [Paraburkholderia sp. SIMBA_030]|uniref:hypothetical protein n=1 Tax=Paraburkholderia sp. SIMBA_030 TaxID=3085773 RepID=UPI00397C42F0